MVEALQCKLLIGCLLNVNSLDALSQVKAQRYERAANAEIRRLLGTVRKSKEYSGYELSVIFNSRSRIYTFLLQPENKKK